MNLTASALDVELEHLRIDVANLDVLRKMTRAQERRVMGEVFVWWQKARSIDGYLEQQYEANNITFNQTRSEVNFRPLLRLVTNNNISDNDLDTWAMVFPKVLEDVNKSPKHYADEPAEKIANFVNQKGGKRALAGYYTSNKAVNEAEPNAEMEPDSLFTIDESEFNHLLKIESENYYASLQSQINISIPTVKTTEAGYSLVLVKQDGSKSNLIGSIDHAKIIAELIINTYRNDFEALPLTIRSILETLHILNVPKSLADSADKFIEYSNLKDTWNEGKKELAVKRLIYRPANKDFLLSCQQVPCSVVLVAKPKMPLIDREYGDTFLSIGTRKSIETRLLHQATFNLFTTDNKDHFRTTPSSGLSANSINLRTKLLIDDTDKVKAVKVIQRTINLNHPPISFIPFYLMFGEPRWQVINKPADFEPTWRSKLDLNWLRGASNQFLSPWITEYGKKAKRNVNALLNFSANDQTISIGFEYKEGIGFDSHFSIALPLSSSTGKVRLVVKSYDLAFVLRQIADLNVLGSIFIEADEFAVVLKFETTANNYECWIPACDLNGKRITKHFTVYEPTTSRDPEVTYDPESEYEMTEGEFKQLSAKLKRLRKHEPT
jgi:hypothetical protein